MKCDRKPAETGEWPQANSYSFAKSVHCLALLAATSQAQSQPGYDLFLMHKVIYQQTDLYTAVDIKPDRPSSVISFFLNESEFTAGYE